MDAHQWILTGFCNNSVSDGGGAKARGEREEKRGSVSFPDSEGLFLKDRKVEIMKYTGQGRGPLQDNI